MSSNSRNFYYTSNEASSSRSANRRQSLPPLRSVLGAQLDLPVQSRSGSGSYDLRAMGNALPLPSEYRSTPRSSSGAGMHADRNRDRDGPREFRDHRSYTGPPSTNLPTTNTHRTGNAYGHSHTASLSNSYHARPMTPTPTHAEPRHAYASPSSNPYTPDTGHGSKKYACTWPGCDKRFERQNALDTHMNIHTEEKPYPCPVPGCGKVFNVRSNMRRHLLTHKECPIDKDEDPHMSSQSAKHYSY